METTPIALFTRDGSPAGDRRVFANEKGQLGFQQPRICGRCGGGGGSDKWAHTGWTCFDCGGAGRRGTEFVRLYTADKLAAMNAMRDKREAKRRAEAQAKADKLAAEAAARNDAFLAEHGALLAAATPYLDRSEFLRDVCEKARRSNSLSEKQANAIRSTIEKMAAGERLRAASEHVGTPGERITTTVTVERVYSFERAKFGAPWIAELVHIVTMRDANGNQLVAKGRFYAEKGQQFAIKATIKDHGEYNGQKQTTIQRVARVE